MHKRVLLEMLGVSQHSDKHILACNVKVQTAADDQSDQTLFDISKKSVEEDNQSTYRFRKIPSSE